MTYDRLSDAVEYNSGPGWVDINMQHLKYLPGQVRDNLKTNKSMRQGFANLCQHIGTCLRAKIIPIEDNVLYALYIASEWPRATMDFLRRGGSVASVASMIFEDAMLNDELSGYGECSEAFETDIAELPECRNDHEFSFVSGMCGYNRFL
jgi:hypothetical protein